MRVTAVGPGRGEKVIDAVDRIGVWVKREGKFHSRSMDKKDLWWYIVKYRVKYQGKPIIVELFNDRSGFNEITLIGTDKSSLLSLRKLLRIVAGYKT